MQTTMTSLQRERYAYHIMRRDHLMRAARVLKRAHKPSPGTVAGMHDCVRLARVHNVTARMWRHQEHVPNEVL